MIVNEEFALFVVEEQGEKRLQFNAPVRYRAFVKTLGIGQELRCRITDPVRDVRHNSKLHAVLNEAAEALGWEDKVEFKEQVLLRLRPAGVDPLTGFAKREKTRDMSDEQIDQLVLEVKAFTQHLMPGFVFKFDAEQDGFARTA